MSFEKDVELFVDVTQKEMDKLLRATAVEVMSRVVRKTPVDTGRARANWSMAKNSPPQKISENTDRSGNSSISQGEQIANASNRKDDLYIINNLPYIERLEDGSSRQAPQGMVKTTVAEWKGIVAEKARG